MKSKKRIIVICITLMLLVTVGVYIGYKLYMKNYYKKNWDLRENTSEELRNYQSYWICNGRLMKSEEGYIFVHSSKEYEGARLCFWNGESSEYSILCEVANCEHSSAKCAAWLSEYAIHIQYSNGYIFYVDIDEEGNQWLYRCEDDGTNRCTMLLLADKDENANISEMWVQGNHVLVVEAKYIDGGYKTTLTDYDMQKKGKDGYITEVVNTDEAKYIWLYEALDNEILYMIAYDNKDEMYIYNVDTGKNSLFKIFEKNTGFCNYDGEIYVYNDGENSVLLKDGKETVLNPGKMDQLGWDGKYIYVDNVPMFTQDEEIYAMDHILRVYDRNGTLLYTIDMPQNSKERLWVCYYGDGEKIFVTDFVGDEIFVMDVDDLEKGEWTLLLLDE